MKYAHFILAIIITPCLSVMVFASNPDAQEEIFKRSVADNRVLPSGDCIEENLNTAWLHQKAIRTLAKENADLYPKSLPDGEIPTMNDMGFHWGLGHAITVQLSKIIHQSQPTKLLEIGPCYGFDAITLIKKYPNLNISAVEISKDHVALMETLMERSLKPGEKDRLTVYQSDFLNNTLPLKEKSFDVAVISKVLHFYDDQSVTKFIETLYRLIKPGGYVVMSHMSNHAIKIIEYVTWVFGGYLPQPEKLIGSVIRCKKIQWGYFFSPEDIARLNDKNPISPGFKIVANQYLGIIHEKRAAKYWWLGGANLQETTLFTVLQRPDED